jgi:hypothetical protein
LPTTADRAFIDDSSGGARSLGIATDDLVQGTVDQRDVMLQSQMHGSRRLLTAIEFTVVSLLVTNSYVRCTFDSEDCKVDGYLLLTMGTFPENGRS